MKALTLKQPWAQALVDGPKDIENRSFHWRGAPGWLAVHCGKSVDENYDMHSFFEPKESRCHPGFVIGLVYVKQCVHVDQALARSPWAVGPVQWEVTRKIPLYDNEMFKTRGWPGLFDVPYSLRERDVVLTLEDGWISIPLKGRP